MFCVRDMPVKHIRIVDVVTDRMSFRSPLHVFYLLDLQSSGPLLKVDSMVDRLTGPGQ